MRGPDPHVFMFFEVVRAPSPDPKATHWPNHTVLRGGAPVRHIHLVPLTAFGRSSAIEGLWQEALHRNMLSWTQASLMRNCLMTLKIFAIW